MDKIVLLFSKLGEIRKNNPNCYRYDIFKDRDLLDCDTPQYAWQWNFTEEEYNQIKELLKQYSDTLPVIITRSSISAKLLQLYVSEWYKREYNGNDGENRSFDEIETGIRAEDVCMALGIDENRVYRSQVDDEGNEAGNHRWLDTLYVDGGLPLRYLSEKENDFAQSVRRILLGNVHDDERIAGALGDLCHNNVINQSYRARELHPMDKDASIYDFIQELVKGTLIVPGFENFTDLINDVRENVEKERRLRSPFSFKWLFEFDDNRREINTLFQFSGPQTLSDSFIEYYHLENNDYFTIVVKRDNQKLYTAEYDKRHYCRRTVNYVGAFIPGTVITVVIEETGALISTHELDLTDPKLLMVDDFDLNSYKLCDSRHLATNNCRILTSIEWSCDTDVHLQMSEYNVNNEQYRIFFIEQTTNAIRLISGNEFKTFNPNIPLCWTLIDSSCALQMEIPTKEILYNASNTSFLKSDGDSIIRTNHVKFAAKGSREWNDTPKLGEIRAKIDINGGESIDPVKFLNVGDLNILKISSDRNNCTIRFDWAGGTVSSEEATQCENNCFNIERAHLNSRYARFKFTPLMGTGTPFVVHIIPLFEDFIFLDKDSNEVRHNSLIPLEDLNNYRYYQVNNNIKIRLGNNNETEYVYNDNDNVIRIHCHKITNNTNTRILREIPRESYLTTFFNGTNVIRNLLEKDTRSIKQSDAKVRIYNGNQEIIFYFKEFPYRLRVRRDNKIEVLDRIRHGNEELQLPLYKGCLKAIPIDNPDDNPINLSSCDECNIFNIPKEMINHSYSQWLVYGDFKGLIYPTLVDMRGTFERTKREQRRNFTLNVIKNNLVNDTIFGDSWKKAITWFEMIPQGHIPGIEMLDLIVIADDPILLIKFVLQLFIKNYRLQDNGLIENLLEFQRQMDFLWMWVPKSDVINDFINSDSLEGYGIQSEEEYKNQLLRDFNTWFSRLKRESNPSKLYLEPNINAHGEGLRTDEAKKFFEECSYQLTHLSDNRNWPWCSDSCRDFFEQYRNVFRNPTPNKNWIWTRYLANCYANLWNPDWSYEVRKEIHRSIIYGLKFQFPENQ